MSDKPSFTWLHFTDLHVGLTSQGWLWPTLKHLLYLDIRKVIEKSGPPDVVIFSGDLTQQGLDAEYDQLTRVLSELWSEFKIIGFLPNLIAIPGNHDLIRPAPDTPEAIALKRWWQEDTVRKSFWNKGDSPYASLVSNAFDGFSRWYGSVETAGIPVLRPDLGVITGDASYRSSMGAVAIGIVALNSAWLQIGPENYKGRLTVDPRQLGAVTSDDPDKWCRSHDFNLLITHHPRDWLNPTSQEGWEGEINPAGRFDLHLYGHMHTPDAATIARGGGLPKRTFQGPSLFGLEKIGGKTERIHGYSIGKVTLDGACRTLEIWPRRLETLLGGSRKLVPDHRFDLAANEAIVEAYRMDAEPARSTSSKAIASVDALKIPTADGSANDVLEHVEYFLAPARGHASVRRIEQDACLKELEDSRAVWLVSDWGMGEDGFVASVRQRLLEEDAPVYRLPMNEFRGQERFLKEFPDSYGCSFEKLCEMISNRGCSYVLLDEIPTGQVVRQGLPVELEVDSLVKVFTEYCPGARLFLRVRRKPEASSFREVSLAPLDEVEVQAYVASQEAGPPELQRADVLSKIYRYSEGLVSRLDSALRDLRIVTIDELISSNLELRASGLPTDVAPAALQTVISELCNSSEDNLARSHELLKCLSVFPHGEQLERVKRFHHSRPFFHIHARELLDRGLITSTTNSQVGLAEEESAIRLLTVPSVVRECLGDRLEGDEGESIRRRALGLYFGADWKTGKFSYPSGHRFDQALCSGHAIANASALVLRHVAKAVASGDGEEIASSLRLASAYSAALISGDHYRSIVVFCEDLLALVENCAPGPSVAFIKYQFGISLRMTGARERAKAVINQIESHHLSKRLRQSYFVTKALTHEVVGEAEEAVSAAKKAIAIDKRVPDVLEAQRIIIEYTTTGSVRTSKLEALEKTCRRRKAILAANNLSIKLASESGEFAEAEKLLTPAFQSAVGMRDYYTATRASLSLAKIALEQGRSLGDLEKARIIAAYHFLFNERIPTLFDSAHRVLWSVFESENDIPNLIRLFRYSSLTWRLRQEVSIEAEYLARLANHIDHSVLADIRAVDRETAYYLVRVSSAVGSRATDSGLPSVAASAEAP